MNRPPRPHGGGPHRTRGFTLLELLIVIMVITIVLAIATQSYSAYLERTISRRAADVFALDLAAARATALRDRQPITVHFFEAQKSYIMRDVDNNEVLRRDYGAGASVALTTLHLDFPGDSLVMNGRGIIDLSGVPGMLGEARFTSGRGGATVRFNGMGAARVIVQ